MGLSQRDVAGRANLTGAYIGWIEQGLRNPSRPSVIRIADALSIPHEDALKAGGYFPRGEPARLEPDEQELLEKYRQSLPALRQSILELARRLAGFSEDPGDPPG